MAWQNLTEIAGVSISYLSGVSSPPTDNVQYDALVLGQNSSAWARGDTSPKTWNIDNKLQINTTVNSSERSTYCASIETGHVFMNATGGGGSSVKRADTCFWIDDTNERAYCVGAFATDYGNTWILYPNISVAYQEELYQIIKGLVPIPYNWQSVSSISGKNGILQPLSTLVNINDGNPVSGASASAVNIIPASVVSGMIQTGASDVIVSFEIPQLTSGTYDSIKLVGKRGGIPRSKTDGEFIETLSDSDTSKTLTGLTKGVTYWFVIFAEDSKGSSSESDPYPYETGEGESVAFFEIDLGQGGKDIVRYDASKSIGSHKQGELYGNYSIANDELSTNGYIYWDYDATENPKSIPADCCLYFEYDTLFTGNEGYLDWYVLDSNNDQQIYWCYDTQYAFQSNKWYNCLVVAEVKNGYIKRYKYVLDGIEISHDTANIKMPCTDAEGSIGISEIYFHTTRPTKIKNMSIYYDFSTYTEAGGGGGGGSGASGSNPVS